MLLTNPLALDIPLSLRASWAAQPGRADPRAPTPTVVASDSPSAAGAFDMGRLVLVMWLLGAGVPCLAQAPERSTAGPPITARVVSRAEQEQFLLDAKVVKVRGAKKGITGTQRATLSDGALTHDASVQAIDESATGYQTASSVELNFRDYWAYNVAAYRLAVMLGLDNVPPSVKRVFRGADTAFTWWVDDVVMDEQERVKKKRTPPNALYWNGQTYILRVFDELIANSDRNQGNMLIDRQWKLWLIDHSRAFRTNEKLRNPTRLTRCERSLLARMQALTQASLKKELGDFLNDREIRSLLKRRDALVQRFDELGPTALYDLKPPRT